MNSQNDVKKSGLNYALLIGALVVVVIAAFTVQFDTVDLAIKKTGILGKKAAEEASLKEEKKEPDLEPLREDLEKKAAILLNNPNLKTVIKLVKLVTPNTESMQKTRLTVSEVLKQNKYQFVEAISPGKIRIIVILKSKDWPELSAKLIEASDLDGYEYNGPSKTAVAGDVDTVIAEIEILKKN